MTGRDRVAMSAGRVKGLVNLARIRFVNHPEDGKFARMTGIGRGHRPRSATASLARFLGLLAILVSCLSVSAQAAEGLLEARGYRIAGDATRVRMLLDFDRKPDFDWFILRAPHRLVIDLPETRFGIDPEETMARGLVSEVRYGEIGEGRSRIILAAKGPFAVESVEVLKNADGEGYRLVVNLIASSEKEFDAALASRSEALRDSRVLSGSRGDRVAPRAERQNKRFTVVIDPGHGGIDGGAEGRNGTVEKTITLAFGLELRNHLKETGLYDVHMTRENDTFLRLDERVRIARQHDADLLISIHADTLRAGGVNGATVYTLSERASDPQAAAAAVRENLADELAGVTVEEEKNEVADILADLIRRETQQFSIRFARSVIGEFTGKIDLINNPHRSAGFRVLRAPDVPSVLLELGYLSDPRDEARLRDVEWRRKAAESIGRAVGHFAAAKAGAGG